MHIFKDVKAQNLLSNNKQFYCESNAGAKVMTPNFKTIFLIILTVNYASSQWGGNDIFTSLEAMRRLWVEDKLFVSKLEDTISTMKELIPHMER